MTGICKVNRPAASTTGSRVGAKQASKSTPENMAVDAAGEAMLRGLSAVPKERFTRFPSRSKLAISSRHKWVR